VVIVGVVVDDGDVEVEVVDEVEVEVEVVDEVEVRVEIEVEIDVESPVVILVVELLTQPAAIKINIAKNDISTNPRCAFILFSLHLSKSRVKLHNILMIYTEKR
jgi:hypothetical protein